MAPKNPDTVAFKNSIFLDMETRWPLIDDLMGGTAKMRESGDTWLIKHPREHVDSYNSRLNNSFLFGAYNDSLNDIVSKPFSKEVTLKGDISDRLLDIADNMDYSGTALTPFVKHGFKEGVHRGIIHLLVDFPVTNGQLSLAEERGQGIRPFFIWISSRDLIGWKTIVTSNGKSVLSEIRFKEMRTESIGTYKTTMVEYIRVIKLGVWELWRNSKKRGDIEDDYQLVEEGKYTFPGIPLVTLYYNKNDFMSGYPCLEELAWQNMAHWNSDSDRRNTLKFASVGLLFIKGLSEEEKDKEIIIGPNQVIKVNSSEADMKYVEYTGNAIDGGRDIVQDIEARLKALGLRPLLQKTGNPTATEKAIDTAESHSQAQAWIRTTENGLETAFSIAHQWMKLTEDPSFGIDIFNEFGIAMNVTELSELLKSRLSGQISHATYLSEIKRRALLSDDVNVEEEVKAVQAEEIPEETVNA